MAKAKPRRPLSARDQKAFSELALKHLDELFAAAMRLTKNRRDAEDLVQETYLRAYSFFGRFERGSNCRAWMFRILLNNFINGYRKKRKEREVSFLLRNEPSLRRWVPAEPKPASFDPEADRAGRYFGDEVRKALSELPAQFRTAVILADLQDMSYLEIADVMSCPAGTVMSRIYRGRRLLQQRLQAYAQRRGLAQGPEAEPVLDPIAA